MALTDQIKKLLEELKNSNTPIEEEPIIIGRFGRQFEHSFLGYTLPDEENLFFKPEEYLSFSEAFEKMTKIQPEGYDPSNPTGGCNKEFFEAIQSFMRYGKDDLRYFISVGTEMDFWHGADAVFSWRNATVTIDVTVDPKKEKSKADFLIRPTDVESGEVYISIARKISVLLLHRYFEGLGHRPLSEQSE